MYSGAARADVINFDLGTGNTAINGYTGPYASVQVDLTSSTMATITFTSLTNSGNIYLMGGAGAAAVNVNASTWTIGTFSATNSGTGFTPGQLSDGGAGNEDGFGSFNQTITSFDGYTHSSDIISFILTNTSSTWADANAVLTANSNGALGAAHIFVTSDPANARNGALATGYAAGNGGGGPPITIPEPRSLLLLATGLLMLGVASRRPKLRGRRSVAL
jgi:hypothetical protein